MLNYLSQQVPTCTYPVLPSEVNIDTNFIAKNLRRLAEVAATSGVELACEAPAWGIAATTWQEIQHIIQLTGCSNVKHCLDTFHSE